MDILKLPYAEYLCKNDRYEDALKVYKSMNRLDLSSKTLYIMTENASKEARFKDAARLFW
jgi:intraflagellar transport protein 122